MLTQQHSQQATFSFCTSEGWSITLLSSEFSEPIQPNELVGPAMYGSNVILET
jgi:hypothetical protein